MIVRAATIYVKAVVNQEQEKDMQAPIRYRKPPVELQLKTM
jgi:hypothetical protein